MRNRLRGVALLACLAATQLGAGDIPGFTWKGKPNFPGFARGMTSGPDGNLWLTDADHNELGRVAQDGTVVDDYKLGTYTGFPIPTANSFPRPITAGPDGNLWFVELNNGGKLGRCTTAGSITEFPLPGPSGPDWEIAAGPDGNLWLSNSRNNSSTVARLLKVTPQGAATPFPLAAGISVFTLVGGADGNIWFIEKNATTGAIGRITPEDVVTDFWLAANHFAADLTLGPDGNIWFTESSANMIGRITLDGVITEFAIPIPNSYPRGIASGVDGNIWFTEYDAHKIGQLVVATATDQGQATFNDSGSWTFYQAVALIPLTGTGANAGTLVELGMRGESALPAIATAPPCSRIAFIVLESSSGTSNAEEIAANAPDACAGLYLGMVPSFAVRDPASRTKGHFYVYARNFGPDTARSVRIIARKLSLDAQVAGFKADSWAGTDCEKVDSQTVACSVPELAKYEAVGVDVQVQVSPGVLSFTVFGLALAATPDPEPKDNFRTERITRSAFTDDTLPTEPGLVVLIPVRGHPH